MTDRMPNNEVIISNADMSAIVLAKPPPLNSGKKKKKTGAFGLFKAALSIMRKRPNSDKGSKNSDPNLNPTAPNANWTKLVDAMRPLHLQENIQSPTSESTPTRMFPADNFEETIPPPSPAPSSSAGTMSQYASAMSLRDLVDSSDDEEEEDPDVVFDAICGDEMIDTKADEFIAQFYQQIRIQNTEQHRGKH